MLKVMVSTHETQGTRANDFCWVPDGELVNFAMECDGEAVDGSCGCRRSMGGLISHKATTTIRVVEREMTTEQYVQAVYDSYVSGGWAAIDTGEDWKEIAQADVEDLLQIADTFPLNSVLEKRGNTFVLRGPATAPEVIVSGN